jgi:pteridine reductase
MIPSGSVALVTGAARRIGRAIALRLARGGLRVAVHHRSRHREAAAVAKRIRDFGGEAAVVQADLDTARGPKRLVDAVERSLGPVDVLVCSASVFRPSPVLARTHDAEAIVAVNLLAPWHLARLVAPGMAKRGRGRIVNLGDIHAERPLKDHAIYSASKAGLHALTLGLARDLAPHVQVNAVAPGAILLPDGVPESRRRALEKRIPAGRFGTPEEVAEAVAFFVFGPDFVTGEVLRVDGGRHTRA